MFKCSNVLHSIIDFSNPLLIVLLLVFLIACSEDPVPKPKGYFRISLPKKEYQWYKSDCPYRFEYPKYAEISIDNDYKAEQCWINIDFPLFRSRIHITYKRVNHNAAELFNDAHTLAYKHTVKADAIDEKEFSDSLRQIYGVLYDIKGNVASSVQFFVTDSLHHFLRGALYFNMKPNKDSLMPVVEFLKKDIIHLMETIEWERESEK